MRGRTSSSSSSSLASAVSSPVRRAMMTDAGERPKTSFATIVGWASRTSVKSTCAVRDSRHVPSRPGADNRGSRESSLCLLNNPLEQRWFRQNVWPEWPLLSRFVRSSQEAGLYLGQGLLVARRRLAGTKCIKSPALFACCEHVEPGVNGTFLTIRFRVSSSCFSESLPFSF